MSELNVYHRNEWHNEYTERCKWTEKWHKPRLKEIQ